MSFGLAQKLPSLQFSIPVSGKYACYVPYACIGSAIVESDPTALHLLRDINMPMSHIRVKFTSAFLKKHPLTKVQIPNEPHYNVIQFEAFNPPDKESDLEVIFVLVHLGDALEIRFPKPYENISNEDVCTEIITTCHSIMPKGAKYNFAVVCSADRNPNVIYKLQRSHHFLPNRELCKRCKDLSRLDNIVLNMSNAVLDKVRVYKYINI